MTVPARLAADTEEADLPPGSGERFAGYGVMGLPFVSGHVLALRRFPASSVGPAYLLRAMGPIAGFAMRAGKVGMAGTTPNGQAFIANPLRVWVIDDSSARIGDDDFGPTGPLAEQTRLGDFWIPQRGIFAIGRTFFRAA